MTPILTFNGDPALKDFYLNPEIAQRKCWDGSKSCAVTCLIQGVSHEQLAKEIGIPLQIAHLVHNLFNGMPASEAEAFSVQFVKALPVGVDVQPALDRYVHRLLSDPIHGIIAFVNPPIKSSIQAVADLYARRLAGDEPSVMEWAEDVSAAVWWASEAASWASCAAVFAAEAKDEDRYAAWVKDRGDAVAWWVGASAAEDSANVAAENVAKVTTGNEIGARAWLAFEEVIKAKAAAGVEAGEAHYSWQANVFLTYLAETALAVS